jgi:magnesium and cobalt transporter
MSDEATNGAAREGGRSRTWLERLGQALGGAEPQDQDELIALLRDAEQRDLIGADALPMIEGVLQVTEMQVRDIMIPRSQMVVVARDSDPADYLPMVIDSAHSRFPVIGDSRDEVVGILLAKDLLGYFARGGSEEFDLREALRPAVFIPESKRLNVLLREFRANRNHMAIVVDEYGGVAGLVTIEDVLEQIVGEIEDEYDFDEGAFIMRHDENNYTAKAHTTLEEFNEYFNTDFQEDGFDTIGGLVLNALGHMPKRGERVQIDGFRFEVLGADSRKIRLLNIRKPEEQAKAVEKIS